MSENPNRQVHGVPDAVLKAMSDAPRKSETKYPTDIIPLPTKGWFYPDGHPLATGEVEIKQMTAKEEDILANPQLRKNGKFLEKLLESLIVDKSVKQQDILVPDKNAIFIAIRRLAYGDEYPISVTCPSCSEVNKITINLSTIENKVFNFEEYARGENSFSFKLPNSGVTVTYKLLNQIDELSIEAELNQLKKLNKEASKEITTRLKYLITSLDGNADKQNIRRFIDDVLTAKDSLALRKHIRDNNPDIDFSFDFTCSNCAFERRQSVPMELSFLWPDVES